MVAGNYIGTDVTGAVALGNGTHGIYVYSGAGSNRIGTDGSDDAFNVNERNVVSANGYYGVRIDGAGSDHNVIAGNYVGTDGTGTASLGNGWGGMWIGGESNGSARTATALPTSRNVT